MFLSEEVVDCLVKATADVNKAAACQNCSLISFWDMEITELMGY